MEDLYSNIPAKGIESLVKISQDVVENIMELKADGEADVDSDTAKFVSLSVFSSNMATENQRRKAFKAIQLKSTIYHTKSQTMKHVVARISNTVTAQSWDREG